MLERAGTTSVTYLYRSEIPTLWSVFFLVLVLISLSLASQERQSVQCSMGFQKVSCVYDYNCLRNPVCDVSRKSNDN